MSPSRKVNFDGWTLRMDVGELTKDGQRVRLQDQPLQVLDELLAHPGEIVTREQLIARLWPKGVVDFDTGLNSAVRKLRVALQDEAETPRYIETVPRKGYRFIGAIDAPVAITPPAPSPAKRVHTYMYAGIGITVLVAALALAALRREFPTPASPSTASRNGDSEQVSPEAYELYVRGQKLLGSSSATHVESTVELFRRATILDPTFARGYVGLGQALLAQIQLLGSQSPELRLKAVSAVDRALELDPLLGEAWIERARLASDPVQAEALYRKGLKLAPDYGRGHGYFASFLFHQTRVAEAIDMIERARKIEPRSPELLLQHAFMLMVEGSDVVGHDKLVREAIAIDADFAGAYAQLAFSQWEYSGEFAAAAKSVERSLAIDPQSPYTRSLGRDIYLDLGDPDAALSVLGETPPPVALVELAQYRGERERAADLLNGVGPEEWFDRGPHATHAAAVRDGADARGEFGPAIQLLQSAHEIRRAPRMHYRAMALVYAHTLKLAGETKRGRQLAETMLGMIDTHAVGRAPNWFSRDRSCTLAILGDDAQALDELAISVKDRHVYRWWYLAGHDPLYAHLRTDPRFKALDSQARQHIAGQRAALEQMRLKGEVPSRGRKQG
jgi:DNA-binding winged helix-turn-helix (wHTH) protein/tetratricopeptide (TPR) repeat protein